MEVYSIGFAQWSAAAFFKALKEAGIRRLIDVRVNNESQLAGFTKRRDLEFFLHELSQVDYFHDLRLAPTKELLKAFRHKRMGWVDYEHEFRRLITDRQIEALYGPANFAMPTALLCSERSPDHCHRRLVLEYLKATSVPAMEIVHL